MRYIYEYIFACFVKTGPSIPLTEIYQQSLPSTFKAILGAHGYKLHENYNPRWRKIIVSEPFLKLVCPEEEERVNLVEGNKIFANKSTLLVDRGQIREGQLIGATNYWKMVILLWPHLFQVGFHILPLHVFMLNGT
jgi:hypothetical protein